MKGHLYKFEKIVFGATPAAVIFAHKNNLPIIFIKQKAPFFFDSATPDCPKLEAYKKMLYILSLSDKVPFYNNVGFAKIDGNTLSLTTKDSRLAKVNFEQAIIFDEEGLNGVDPPVIPESPQYQVLDWFNVRSGMCHAHTQVETGSDFIKWVYFYASDRIDGNHNKKDLVAVSTMTEEQLRDIEYSEIYAKFKILKLMKDAGISGAKNGTSPTGQAKFCPLKIESAHREVRKLTRPHHQDNDYLKFNYEECDIEEWNKASKI
jgi:hypothetical protein